MHGRRDAASGPRRASGGAVAGVAVAALELLARAAGARCVTRDVAVLDTRTRLGTGGPRRSVGRSGPLDPPLDGCLAVDARRGVLELLRPAGLDEALRDDDPRLPRPLRR